MSKKIIASIDVGYGNVKTCKKKDGKLITNSFPSIVTKKNRREGVSAANVSSNDIIDVAVGNVTYLVGPDSINNLSANANITSHLSGDYIYSSKYQALLKAAIYYLDESEIDYVMTGLPVTNFGNPEERAALKKLIEGEHLFFDGKKVVIKRADVIPQPIGGFIDYFMTSENDMNLKDVASLTIDIGYFTLDWVAAIGLKMQDNLCGDIKFGMSELVGIYKDLLEHDTGTTIKTPRVDEAMRNNYTLNINGEPYSFTHLKNEAEELVLDSIGEIKRKVGEWSAFDIIVVSGGGAQFFVSPIENLSKRKVILSKSGIYSNAKGFYMLAEQRVRGGILD